METPLYNALERRDPTVREAALMAALPADCRCGARALLRPIAIGFAGVRPEGSTDRRALADLPLTRKSELIELQRRDPPFGGFAAVPVSALFAADLRLARADLRTRRQGGPITGASRARCLPPGFAPATWCTTPFPTT